MAGFMLEFLAGYEFRKKSEVSRRLGNLEIL